MCIRDSPWYTPGPTWVLNPHAFRSSRIARSDLDASKVITSPFHIINILYDIPKFTVAHMGMYLCFRLHPTVYQPECLNGPIQIILMPVPAPQGEFFPQCRLINLNDPEDVYKRQSL